ncbi:MAG: helix-turn-helix domain-containing protein [Spirochaetes bacterium]|nr:helix-turn-helix domain-containing protein [Spirochaetota bacterium]
MSWVSLPPALMAAVSFYVGFYYLIMFARRRSEVENLAFAITCFAIALYDIFCAGLYNASTIEKGMFWQRLQFAVLALFTISVSWFIYHFTRFRSRIPFIIITAWLSAFFLLGVFIRGVLTLSLSRPFVKTINLWGGVIVYNEVDPGIIYSIQYASMILAAAFLFYVLVRNYRSEEQPNARPILVSMILFFAAALNDVLVGAGVYPFIYLLEYTYLFIILSMAHVLQSRFVTLNREVEELTQQLEEKVNDRTMELFFSEITRDLYAGISGEAGAGADEGKNRKRDAGTSISSLSQDISIVLNIDKLLNRSLEKAMEISAASGGYLFMVGDGGGLETAVRSNNEDVPFWVAETAARTVEERRHRTVEGHDAAGKAGIGALDSLFVPINLREETIGVCCLQRNRKAGQFRETDIRLITAFIAQAASAIENAYLYQRMIDQTAVARQHSITQNIEDKIKKAIAFIQQNYTSDISREGLAASINMHPDSFGRFFKIYTNKKISEYINELRVREAARKIAETGVNIIDIAFSVGFESLPTFNRAFMKVMKVTPTQFREKKH